MRARESNDVGAPIGTSRFRPVYHQPAPPQAEPTVVFPNLVLAEAACNYIPRAQAERVEMYARWSGQAESWPIPLTRCGDPSDPTWA